MRYNPTISNLYQISIVIRLHIPTISPSWRLIQSTQQSSLSDLYQICSKYLVTYPNNLTVVDWSSQPQQSSLSHLYQICSKYLVTRSVSQQSRRLIQSTLTIFFVTSLPNMFQISSDQAPYPNNLICWRLIQSTQQSLWDWLHIPTISTWRLI